MQCLFYIEPDDAHIAKTLSAIDISETLFIIASKSGTTIEVQKIIDTIIQTNQLDPNTFTKPCMAIYSKQSIK